MSFRNRIFILRKPLNGRLCRPMSFASNPPKGLLAFIYSSVSAFTTSFKSLWITPNAIRWSAPKFGDGIDRDDNTPMLRSRISMRFLACSRCGEKYRPHRPRALNESTPRSKSSCDFSSHEWIQRPLFGARFHIFRAFWRGHCSRFSDLKCYTNPIFVKVDNKPCSMSCSCPFDLGTVLTGTITPLCQEAA